MNSLIVSVSDLEAFRRYRTDEDLPLSVLLRQLRREDGPTEMMEAGTALHSILQHAAEGPLDTIDCNGFTFRFDCDADLTLAPIREMRGRRTYQVNGTSVTLSGRVDEIDGLTITDHKFTGRSFDAERFADSYQWRCYLSIFGANRFVYNVFVGDRDEKETERRLYRVKDFHQLPLCRYPELEADVLLEIARYVEFATEHLAA